MYSAAGSLKEAVLVEGHFIAIMAQRGKRKALENATPTKSSHPKKKINLNESVVSSPRRGRPRKIHQQASSSNEQQNSTTNQIDQSATPASTKTRFSIPSFSIPKFGFTPSSTSLNDVVASTSRLNRWMKSLVPELQNFKMMERGKNNDSRGKGKQRQIDEQDHLSAQESAQMIELLDTPVSVKTVHLDKRVSEEQLEPDEDTERKVAESDGYTEGQAAELNEEVNGQAQKGKDEEDGQEAELDEKKEGQAAESNEEKEEEDNEQENDTVEAIHDVKGQNEGEHITQQAHQQTELKESDSEEEEQILIFSTGQSVKDGVIDLTESRSTTTSPEPNVTPKEQEEEMILYAQTSLPPPPPPRRKASGFFSSGTLAREKRHQESQSPSDIIQQLGRLQFGSSKTPSKVLTKASTGFRKKDPIFSQARKSMALGIAHSKVDDLLVSLKGHVKKTLRTPFIDEMLKYRVALARNLDHDDAPEDEIQIRHMREILKRSTFSLRPARRMLKEQERLEREQKLLKRKALGILGRQPLPLSLLADDEDFVKQINQKQGKIAQMVGAGVESRDIAKLRPGQWLNDEVINFYTKLILKRSDEALEKRASGREAKKRLLQASYSDEEERTKDIATAREVKRYWNGIWNVWTFTSFFWEKLTNGGYSGVRAWTRKVDIFTKDLILLPINMGQMHWVCAAINMRKCRFEYYDSMHGRNRAIFTILRNYLQSEYADKKKESAGPLLLSGWTNYYSKQSPSQSNGFDCGVFASMTLEQLSRRSPTDGDLKDELNVETIVQKSKELAEQKGSADEEKGSESEEDGIEEEEEEWNFSQTDMPYLRRRMVYEIAKTKLMNE